MFSTHYSAYIDFHGVLEQMYISFYEKTLSLNLESALAVGYWQVPNEKVCQPAVFDHLTPQDTVLNTMRCHKRDDRHALWPCGN